MPFLRRAAKSENIDVLKEEVPLLWKEQVEAGEIDLAIIDFGGRKVGVQREDAGERRRNVVEDIEGRFEARVVDVRLVVPGPRCHDRRHDIEPAALLQSRQPGNRSGGGGTDLPVVGHPGDVLLVARDASLEGEAPVRILRIKVQRLERNRHLRRPTLGIHVGRRVPDALPSPG